MNYSQYGEQAILETLLPDEYGILIDIGALDGQQNSNTRALLERGWRGIMIEPDLRAMLALMKNTAHLDCGYFPVSIDGKSRIAELVCSTDRFNGLSSIAGQIPPGVTMTQKTLVMTPAQLFATCPFYPTLVSIDAEGCDEAILMAWPEEYLPEVFVYEHDKMKNEGEIHAKLTQWQFKQMARTAGNAIWQRQRVLDRWKRSIGNDAGA